MTTHVYMHTTAYLHTNTGTAGSGSHAKQEGKKEVGGGLTLCRSIDALKGTIQLFQRLVQHVGLFHCVVWAEEGMVANVLAGNAHSQHAHTHKQGGMEEEVGIDTHNNTAGQNARGGTHTHTHTHTHTCVNIHMQRHRLTHTLQFCQLLLLFLQGIFHVLVPVTHRHTTHSLSRASQTSRRRLTASCMLIRMYTHRYTETCMQTQAWRHNWWHGV